MVKRSKYVKEKTRRKLVEKENRELKNAVRHPGSLRDLGFSEKEPLKKQKNAIMKADRKYGKKETDRKLGFLEAVTHRYPKINERIKSILKWNEKE